LGKCFKLREYQGDRHKTIQVKSGKRTRKRALRSGTVVTIKNITYVTY